MLDEYKELSEEFLPMLKAKAECFRSYIEELKKKFGIPTGQDQRIDEVIVVSHRRFWVTIHEERLPILDDDEFLTRLGARQDLLSNLNRTKG